MSIFTSAAEDAVGAAVPGVGWIGFILKHLGLIGCAILLLLLAVAWGDSRHWKKAAANEHDLRIAEVTKAVGALNVTTASLNQVRAALDENNRVIEAEAAQLDRMKQKVAADDARNTERAKSTDAMIAALRSAKVDPKQPCTADAQDLSALEGL